jgi:hypothetical protein
MCNRTQADIAIGNLVAWQRQFSAATLTAFETLRGAILCRNEHAGRARILDYVECNEALAVED